MKKFVFLSSLIFAASIAVLANVEYRDSDSFSSLIRANAEALSQGEYNDKFYYIAKYDIASMFKVTAVSGEASIQIGALLTMTEFETEVNGNVQGAWVNCHKRYCCSTTEKQNVECIPGGGWMVCHPQCDHSNNQI